MDNINELLVAMRLLPYHCEIPRYAFDDELYKCTFHLINNSLLTIQRSHSFMFITHRLVCHCVSLAACYVHVRLLYVLNKDLRCMCKLFFSFIRYYRVLLLVLFMACQWHCSLTDI